MNPEKPIFRTLQVLVARAAAEVKPGESHIAHVYHDDWCPALESYSMLDCCCKPEVVIENVT